MKTLRMYPSSLNDRFLDEAVDALTSGDIIVYPTDSLYALGCDALNNNAIERLCRIKGIDPKKQSLSIVCASLSMASEYARIDNEAFRILRTNLPGPFTFVLPAATTLPKVFKGRRTVGIRIPDNPIAIALAERLGHPLLSTSIPQAEEGIDPAVVAVEYDDVATMLIDGGEGPATPSTVVDLTDSHSPEILREGLGDLR